MRGTWGRICLFCVSVAATSPGKVTLYRVAHLEQFAILSRKGGKPVEVAGETRLFTTCSEDPHRTEALESEAKVR